jgi:multiple antibiotic resistance protein
MTVTSAALLLLLVMDPFGNVPFFLSALSHVDASRHRWIVFRELLIALAVLVLFLFAGPMVLSALRISEPALTVAGGTILFLISLQMVFPGLAVSRDESREGEPLVVPLAIPYVAGPSAIAAVLFIMNREPGRWPEWLLALLIAWLLTGAILWLATGFKQLLGERGLIAMERLMGMVLTTIAVQMFLTGIAEFFHMG